MSNLSSNLSEFSLIALISGLAIILSLVLTPFVIAFARKFGVVDKPNVRKVHKNAMPRMGGAAFFLSFHLAILVEILIGGHSFSQPMMAILAGGVVIFALGLWDDLKEISPKAKFLVQFGVAAFICSQGILFDSITNPITGGSLIMPAWVSWPLTFFWIVGVSNAINLMDGLDGLAAGVTTITLITLSAVSLSLGDVHLLWVTVPLAGALLGFLRYNFNPARTFMGDCGSLYLGYMVAALSVASSGMSSATLSLTIPLLTLGLPIFDTLFAIFRRTATGRGPFSPDKEHIHHKLLSIGFSHRQTVLILYGFTGILSIGAFLMLAVRHRDVAMLFLLYGTLFFFLVRRLNWMKPIYQHWHRITQAANHRLYSNNYREKTFLSRVFRFFTNSSWSRLPFDIAMIVISWGLAGWLQRDSLSLALPSFEAKAAHWLATTQSFFQNTNGAFLLFGGLTLLFLNHPSRTKLIWRYIEIHHMARYYRAASLSVLLTYFFAPFLFPTQAMGTGFYFLLWVFTCCGLSASRLLMNFYFKFIRRRMLYFKEGDRVLIFGAGDSGFHLQKTLLIDKTMDYRVVGFIDDDPRKQGKTIWEAPVLGKTTDIPDLVLKHKIQRILLPIHLAPANKKFLMEKATEAGIKVYSVYTSIKEASCQDSYIQAANGNFMAKAAMLESAITSETAGIKEPK